MIGRGVEGVKSALGAKVWVEMNVPCDGWSSGREIEVVNEANCSESGCDDDIGC